MSFSINEDDMLQITKHAVHDLRSPLASLRMLCRFTKSMSEQEKGVLETCTERMNSIVDILGKKFVALSNQVNVLQNAEKIETINPNYSIKKMLLEKGTEYCEKEVRFSYLPDLGCENLTLDGCMSDFERMLSNLINNGIEACDEEDGIIRIKLSFIGNVICLSVSDNGKGIPEEVLAKMRQGELVTHGKKNGQGLGFTQIKATANKMNGNVKIDSTLGVGTTISISFKK